MASTIPDLSKPVLVSEDIFVSLHNPLPLGNVKTMAYGACALAFAINAASMTVSPDLFAYSMTGAFLSSASINLKFHGTIQRLSTSNSFATRIVEVSQYTPLGERRVVLHMVANFHKQEEKTLTAFSCSPSRPFTSPEDSWTIEKRNKCLSSQSRLPKSAMTQYNSAFQLIEKYFDWRQVPDSIATETLHGFWKPATLSQQQLSTPDRASLDWLRPKAAPDGYINHLLVLAFIADGFNAFTPFVHAGFAIQDVAQASNLDFALRIFTCHLNLSEWHLREIKAIAGGEGRTFGDTKIWSSDGRLIASMTHQTLLRPVSSVHMPSGTQDPDFRRKFQAPKRDGSSL
jgi:acyl-CoA thioesterase II